MKPLVPIVCLTAGVALGWFGRPLIGSKSEPTLTAAPASATANHSSEARASSDTAEKPSERSSSRRTPSDNSEAKAKEREKMKEAGKKQQQMMAKRMTDIQRKKFEARLAKLTADLNLTPEQQAQVKAGMEKRFEKMGELFSFDGEPDGEKMKSLTDLMKADGLDEATASVLTEDQKKDYADFKGKERQNRVESRALKDLGNITTALELSPEQRDGVYQVLSDEAAKREDNQKTGGLMSMFTEGMGIQIDDELGVQDLMQEQMEAQMGGGRNGVDMGDMQKKLRESVKLRTEQRLEALRPHLNESQIKQYQAHLEAKSAGMLNMFGGGAEEPESK